MRTILLARVDLRDQNQTLQKAAPKDAPRFSWHAWDITDRKAESRDEPPKSVCGQAFAHIDAHDAKPADEHMCPKCQDGIPAAAGGEPFNIVEGLPQS